MASAGAHLGAFCAMAGAAMLSVIDLEPPPREIDGYAHRAPRVTIPEPSVPPYGVRRGSGAGAPRGPGHEPPR